MDRKSELLLRVYIVFFGFLLLAAIIMGKVIKISLWEGEKWRELGGRDVKWIDVEGERGNIYDEHGNLLATTLPYFDIFLDFKTSKDAIFNANVEALAQSLSQHFGRTSRSWKEELIRGRKAAKSKKPGSSYYPLLKRITKEKRDLLLTFPIFKEGRYKSGLQWEEKTTRGKPYQEMCSRTIGLHRINASKVGLEQTYDGILAGDKNKRLMRRFPGGLWLPVYDPGETSQKRGGDIITTLDMHIQDVVHQELNEALIKYKAEAGTAIVMEVKTGAIKAISNLGQDGSGAYVEDYNYGVGRLSEPGSTFKLVSALAMLEDKSLDLNTIVALNQGKKKFYDRTMSDSEQHGKAFASFQTVFEISSNVGMANMAYDLYGKSRSGWLEFYEAINKLGVMDSTGIEIEGEGKPFFKDPNNTSGQTAQRWSGTTVPWMAHGYELEMTPLQILNIYNAVANDGRMMKPYLTKEIISSNGKSRKIAPRVIKEKIASPSAIKKAQVLLKGVAESGTARKLKVSNTSFAGKTGTTRLNYWKGSENKEYNASFVGYFPADKPEYSIIVVVYNPKGAFYGSEVAGPIFRDVVQRISGMGQRSMPEFVEGRKVVKAHSGFKNDYTKLLEFIGVEYDNSSTGNWVDLKSKSHEVSIEAKKIKTKMVPDVRGMGLRDAVYVLESLGLDVEVLGLGKVEKQSLLPGSRLNKKSITIHLK